MIEQLFQTSRAPFIVVRDRQLHVGGCAYSELTVQIHEVLPVRKLFIERKLECYSLDCRTGSKGQFRELCTNRRLCGRRLQLRLTYRHEQQDHPAVLEIAQHSFHNFEKVLADAGAIEALPGVLVQIAASRTATGWTELHFHFPF
jgi:hypothetical protein